MLPPTGLPKKNDVQEAFRELCLKGGGTGGGPVHGKVQELLRDAGRSLNRFGYQETAHHLAAFPNRNPWHVCFAVSLAWGHLAKLELAMTDAVTAFLETHDGIWLDKASAHCLERGPDALRRPLASASDVFSSIRLPDALPSSLSGVKSAQNRWLGRVLGPPRVPYIGSWNSSAMFMVALFAQPALASSMTEVEVVLPPGGPIFTALRVLHQTHVLQDAPDGNDLDDGGWEPGVLYGNNALMQTLIKGCGDLNMVDLHSGLYMLGTKYPYANQWLL